MRPRPDGWLKHGLARGVVAVFLALQLLPLVPQGVNAASSVSVAAWICPAGLDVSGLDETALQAQCAQPSVGTTFALSTGGLNRRRVTSADQPAVWPAVAGDFQLAIEDPKSEPAVIVCDHSGVSTYFDAPAGQINGTLAEGDSLRCNWFRLSSAPVDIHPTPEPTTGVSSDTEMPTAGAEGPATPTSTGDPSSGEFSGPIDIGGRSLYVACTGSGETTIVFEAGGPGGYSDRWAGIVPEISAEFRVCSYDRAGLGQSDPPTSGTRTIQDSVNDLRALITSAPLTCPCIFVGESWGANVVRLYAGQYPSGVAGLVLVDPIPPGFVDKFLSLVPSDTPGYSSLMGSDNPEQMDQLASLRQSDTATTPPTVPAVVMTHGLVLGFPVTFPVDRLETVWRTSQEELALKLHAQFVVAKLSSNSIVRDQPDLVIEAIQTVGLAVLDPVNTKSSVVVRRVNATNNPLVGSCFQVYLDAGRGERGDYRGAACDSDFDSEENGVITLIGLEPGDYVLQEISPPEGLSAAPDQTVSVAGLASHVTVKTDERDESPENLVTVNLAELNGSGMTGTVTLSANGDQTDVSIEVAGATEGHPAHIHFGSCETLLEVAYPLTSVDANGKSHTTVDVALADLVAGDFSINLHRSQADIATYVACGRIGN